MEQHTRTPGTAEQPIIPVAPRQPPGQTRGQTRGIVLLLLALSALYVVEISHGLPNQRSTWAVDGDPLMPLIFAKRALLDGWNSGWHTPYPDFHRFVLLVFQVPYMALQYAFGNLDGLSAEAGYPYGLQDFDTIYTHLAIITRTVSAAMALGVVLFAFKIGRTLFPERPAIFGSLLLAASPAVIYYVHTESLDIPMLFWLSAAFYCYVRVLQTFRLRYYLWLAVLASVSTATKDYAYGAFVLMPLPLVWYLARSQAGHVSLKTLVTAAFDRRHGMAILAFLVSFVVAENMVWNPSGFINHVQEAGGFDKSHQLTTDFSRVLAPTSMGRIAQFGRVMSFNLGWIGFPVCMLGAAFLVFQGRSQLAWLAWPFAGTYVCSVIPYLPEESSIERPFIPLAFILSIVGGQLLAAAWLATSGRILLRSLACVVLAVIFANGCAVDLMLLNDPRYQAEEWFAANVPASAVVENYGYRSNLPRLHTNWKSQIINQEEAPDASDIQITADGEFFDGLKLRRPDMIVVAEPFARTWSNKKRDLDVAASFRSFFDSLAGEQLGYRRVARFEPSFGGLFGMPQHRRLIPAVSVYEFAGDEDMAAVEAIKRNP